MALNVRSVEPYAEGAAPDGSRSALAAIAGVLTVSLQPGLQVIGAVVAVVRDRLRRPVAPAQDAAALADALISL